MRALVYLAVLTTCVAQATRTAPATGAAAATKADFVAVGALRLPTGDCATGETARWVAYRKAMETLAGRPGAGALALTLVADPGPNVSLTGLDVIALVKPAGGEKVLFDALHGPLAKPPVWPRPSAGLSAEAGLQTLAQYRTPEAAALLVELLPIEPWRRQTIEAIGITEQPHAAGEVVGYLDDPLLAEAALNTCLRLGNAAAVPRVKAYCVKLADKQAGPANEEVRRRLQRALGVLWALDRQGESFDFIGEMLEGQTLSLPKPSTYRDFFRPDVLPARAMELYAKPDGSPRGRLAMRFMDETFGTASEEADDRYEKWPQRYARVGNGVAPLLLACAERGGGAVADGALRALTQRARHTTADQKKQIREVLLRLANAPGPRSGNLAECLAAYPDATPAAATRPGNGPPNPSPRD
ncbi:MAG: hypothetical protein NTV86_21015 [Planctomycetota bacterium]|nr:hypothetical protein [Planctomycetota bacterium]